MRYAQRKIILIASMIGLFALNGCSSGDRTYSDNRKNDKAFTTLFLVDENGYSYANIPYKCDSMHDWKKTPPNGEFSFIAPETCQFDFLGLDGDYGYTDDEIVRIVDERDRGKDGIEYDCSSFGASSTFNDGSFDYDQDDVCSFYL